MKRKCNLHWSKAYLPLLVFHYWCSGEYMLALPKRVFDISFDGKDKALFTIIVFGTEMVL